jgi:uncharacterized protein YjiS (DUF1127 family)
MFKIVKKFRRLLKMHNRYHSTVSELSRLSNRDLADLGIQRADIERVARRSAMQSAGNTSQLS